MTTHHRGTGCPVDRDINLYIDNIEGINTGLDNDNESTSGSDTTIPLEDQRQIATAANLYPATKPS